MIENSISRSPFWLDGHFIVANALEALDADNARQHVMEGVRNFLKRFPTVVQLKFVDGTPYASEETQSWFNREVLVDQGASQSLSLPLDDEEQVHWESTYASALALKKEKKLKEAFGLFQIHCARSSSIREQIFWRYYQARFCYEAGRLDLAVPLLERIDIRICNIRSPYRSL